MKIHLVLLVLTISLCLCLTCTNLSENEDGGSTSQDGSFIALIPSDICPASYRNESSRRQDCFYFQCTGVVTVYYSTSDAGGYGYVNGTYELYTSNNQNKIRINVGDAQYDTDDTIQKLDNGIAIGTKFYQEVSNCY